MAGLRGQFSSKLGFVLASAGSAVGIGNIVGFPVMAAKNGGAAFLLIYIGFVVLVCFPIMLAEVSMGRASQSSPVGAFSSLSSASLWWRKVGGLAVITPLMIAVFYTVITAWIAVYTLHSILGGLDTLAEPDTFERVVASPSLFFYLLPVMGLVFFVLSGGVKNGIERVAKVLMPLLVILLLVLVVFVLTLENSAAGLSYYLVPDFSKVTSRVVNSAVNHAFFSLSLGMGILITYGSYFSRKEKVVGSTRLVAITDTGVAVIAGLLIIPAIFVINPNVEGAELSESSIGMMFSYLPEVFLSLQQYVGYFGASLVASSFFLLVLFAALTSLVSITEIPVAYLVDEKNFSRHASLAWVAIAVLVFVVPAALSFGMVDGLTSFVTYGGMSKSFFDVILDVFYETILPLIGFAVCLFVTYRWKRRGFSAEVARSDDNYLGSALEKYTGFALSTFIPVILLAVFSNNVSQIFFEHNLFGF